MLSQGRGGAFLKKTTSCFVAEVGNACIGFNKIIQSSLGIDLAVLGELGVFRVVVLDVASAHLLGLKIS